MTDSAVLLGLFDGLHRGHMSAIDRLLNQRGKKKIVFTFDSLSMDTKGARGLLTTDPEKRKRLLGLGIDEVVSRDFAEFKNISAEDFIKNTIIGGLCAKTVVCGENFRFGRGGAAGAEELRKICEASGAAAVIVPTVYDGGEPVSTTRIRGLIERGEIVRANELLGYEYGFEGEISHGYGLGSKMGFKTVNIDFDEKRALPKKGVYLSKTEISGEIYPSVTNIGERPTVHGDGKIVIETHILTDCGEVYGAKAKVGLMEFYREEKRFGSLEELKETVAKDINKAKEFYGI